MNVAGSSVDIHHTIKVTFQKAESPVCTAAHSQKCFGIFNFIWTPEDCRCGQPTHLFSGHRRLFSGVSSGRVSFRWGRTDTYTQHGFRRIYIRLNTTLLPEHASEERKPSNRAMFGILGTMDRRVLLQCFLGAVA